MTVNQLFYNTGSTGYKVILKSPVLLKKTNFIILSKKSPVLEKNHFKKVSKSPVLLKNSFDNCIF
jgi:hypothetical protein